MVTSPCFRETLSGEPSVRLAAEQTTRRYRWPGAAFGAGSNAERAAVDHGAVQPSARSFGRAGGGCLSHAFADTCSAHAPCCAPCRLSRPELRGSFQVVAERLDVGHGQVQEREEDDAAAGDEENGIPPCLLSRYPLLRHRPLLVGGEVHHSAHQVDEEGDGAGDEHEAQGNQEGVVHGVGESSETSS